MMGLLMGAISCNDNDEPKRGNGKFTVNTPMINHVYNTSSSRSIPSSTRHRLSSTIMTEAATRH